MTKLKNICVYCGSGPGRNPAYVAAAKKFGTLCAIAHSTLEAVNLAA